MDVDDKNQQGMNHPFFIAGVQRSGTTLLSVMLNKHPAVFMEDRATGFRIISGFKNLYDLWPHNLLHDKTAFIKWLIKNDVQGRLAGLIDYENLDAYDNIRDLIQGSIEKKLQGTGKAIWGDKVPNMQHFINDLLLLIPKAKIIHIVRDGRANASSMSSRSYRNLQLSAQQWVDGNIFGLVNQEILGTDQYKIIHYENLLRQPEVEAKSICNFLDIPYAPEMVNLSDEQLKKEESYVKSFFDTSKINKWQSELDAGQIAKVENIQGPLLQKLGYDLNTSAEKLSFKQLSLCQRIWYNQKDNIRQLFRSEQIGMKNKKMETYRIPFKKRLFTFLRFLVQDLFSASIFKSLFSNFFYKEKHYRPNKKQT